jgi:hypothetical protein
MVEQIKDTRQLMETVRALTIMSETGVWPGLDYYLEKVGGVRPNNDVRVHQDLAEPCLWPVFDHVRFEDDGKPGARYGPRDFMRSLANTLQNQQRNMMTYIDASVHYHTYNLTVLWTDNVTMAELKHQAFDLLIRLFNEIPAP